MDKRNEKMQVLPAEFQNELCVGVADQLKSLIMHQTRHLTPSDVQDVIPDLYSLVVCLAVTVDL